MGKIRAGGYKQRMAESIFLKNKTFNEISIDIDTASGMNENIFYDTNMPCEYNATRSLLRVNRQGSLPFYFIHEKQLMPVEERFFLPNWGSRETEVITENGVNFRRTRNGNQGMGAFTRSDEEGKLKEDWVITGLSIQKILTNIFFIMGNFKEYSLSFYSNTTTWMLKSPVLTVENCEREDKGRVLLEKGVTFEVVEIRIKSLEEPFSLPYIDFLRFSSSLELESSNIMSFSFNQEIKGEEFATGIATKKCDFSFLDFKGMFDKQNPSSPFYKQDLRNFLIMPRIDYYRDGTFKELAASYPIGIFLGEPLDESNSESTVKMTGNSALTTAKDLKTTCHYYGKTNVREVILDLFEDVGVEALVDSSLQEEILTYCFFGGDKLESVLKPILRQYGLIVGETPSGVVTVRPLERSATKFPKAHFSLSNQFKYQVGLEDKTINKLTVRYVENNLSDEGLEQYWIRELLPTFDSEGNIREKKITIKDENGKSQKINVLDMPQGTLELPLLNKYDCTKHKVYPARNPNVPQKEPTLSYNVLLTETFDDSQESYISEVLLSKNNSTEGTPSYLEFEWWADDVIYDGAPATLIKVDVWAYFESTYEYVQYARDYGDNLVYDEEGFAVTQTKEPYLAGEEGGSLFYGEAQIVPPMEDRGKLLKTEKIELKSMRGKIKEINEETKSQASILEFEASKGQVWDRIESDLYIPEKSQSWLWVEETFSQGKIKVRYLNLSASPKNYDIEIYGREFIKKELGSDVYENIESQLIYGEKEGEVENLPVDQIEQYLKLHSKPWQTVALEMIGSPQLNVGDIIQFVSEYNVIGRGQIIKNSLKAEKGNYLSSQITTLALESNEIDPLEDNTLGVVGEIHLGV